MAGYSATPLLKKLGLRENHVIYTYHAPEKYFNWLAPLPRGVVKKNKGEGFDFIHVFVMRQQEFEKEFTKGMKNLKKDGMLWVSWPKKASKIPTTLDENVIRNFGLEQGLVDVKVCAVDDVWSGLKFVFRVKDR